MKKPAAFFALACAAALAGAGWYAATVPPVVREPEAPLAGPWASASGARAGDVVYRADFSDPGVRRGWGLVGDARFQASGAQTVVAADVPWWRAGSANMAFARVDMAPWAGTVLRVSARVRLRGVSVPSAPHLGAKLMVHIPSVQGDLWTNPSLGAGDAPWHEASFVVHVPADAGSGEIYLGLQGSSGGADFQDLSVTLLRSAAPSAAAIPEPPFSPARFRGAVFPENFHERDFSDFAALGGNLVRWQVTTDWKDGYDGEDPERYRAWLAREMDDVQKALDACQKNGLKMVLDLHAPPGGRLPDVSQRMWYDRRWNDLFVQVWKEAAARFKGHPALWAYGLVNEPLERSAPLSGLDAWSTQARAARAVRAIDPDTTILVAPVEMGSPDGFSFLDPVDVPGVAYEVHLYAPAGFTHQGVFAPAVPAPYPGVFDGFAYDRDALRRVLAPVRDFQKRHGAKIFVGEFSAARWAPGADRYLADAISIFEDYGWDWTYFAFRESPIWSLEHADLPADAAHGVSTPGGTARKKAVLEGFAKNARP